MLGIVLVLRRFISWPIARRSICGLQRARSRLFLLHEEFPQRRRNCIVERRGSENHSRRSANKFIQMHYIQSFLGLVSPGGNQWLAPYISTVLIATTIHVQDFRDEAGDRQQGRITFPVVMPEVSRRMTLVLMAAWSFGLAVFWGNGLSVIISASFVGLGLYIAIRVMLQRTEPEDKVTLQLYMVHSF